MLALAGGPRAAFGRTWDYHPLLFGALAFVLGYNLVLFDVLAKTFSMSAGFAPPRRWLRRLSKFFTLERGLLVGVILLLFGAAVELEIVAGWLASGGGPLLAVRGFMLGMVAMIVGVRQSSGLS